MSLVERRDACTSQGRPLNEALCREFAQRLPHWCPRRVEHRTNTVLADRFSRLEGSGEDRGPDLVTHLIGDGDLVTGSIDCSSSVIPHHANVRP